MRFSPFNPTLHFKCEKVAFVDGVYYALSNGAWLRCNQPEINAMAKIKQGRQCFRDYWSLECFDNKCGRALSLNMKAK